jgi:hypothetical protein
LHYQPPYSQGHKHRACVLEGSKIRRVKLKKTIYIFFDEEEKTISARESYDLSFLEMRLPEKTEIFPIVFAIGETLKHFGFTEKDGRNREGCWEFEKEKK